MSTKQEKPKLMVQNVSCIIPETDTLGGLYVGNTYGAQNVQILKEYGIRAVVTTSIQTPTQYPPVQIPFHLKISAHDKNDYQIIQHLEQCLQFIHQCRQVTNVFVHCYAGVSRSVTIVVAYLMRYWGWGVKVAIAFVQAKRIVAKPNDGFMEQLRKYQQRLFGGGDGDGGRPNSTAVISGQHSQQQQSQQRQQAKMSQTQPHLQPQTQSHSQSHHQPQSHFQSQSYSQSNSQIVYQPPYLQKQHSQPQPKPQHHSQLQTFPSQNSHSTTHYSASQPQYQYQYKAELKKPQQLQQQQAPLLHAPTSMTVSKRHSETPIPKILTAGSRGGHDRREMFSPSYPYTVNNSSNNNNNGNHMKMVPTSHTLNTYPTNGNLNSGNNLNNIQVNNHINNTSNGNTNNSNGLSKNNANLNNIKSAKMLIRPKDLPGYKN